MGTLADVETLGQQAALAFTALAGTYATVIIEANAGMPDSTFRLLSAQADVAVIIRARRRGGCGGNRTLPQSVRPDEA